MIGLVNNMPDAALQSTENQFAGLLHEASGGQTVRLRLTSLPELPLVRLAIHREAPHLELQWRLDALVGLEAIRVFDAVRALAGRV